MKCHTENKVNSINWFSFNPEELENNFNKFSHVAHFSLMTDDGCSSCHISGAGIEEEKNDLPNKVFPSGFIAMENNTCKQCHQKGRAPDNCLICHQYHVNPVSSLEQISDRLRRTEESLE